MEEKYLMRRCAIIFALLVCMLFCLSAHADKPMYITLNKDTLSLEPSEVFSLTATVYPATAAQEVVWTSTNKNAVTVDKNGNLLAKNEGTSYVRAYSRDDDSVSARVIVKVEYRQSPDSINASESLLNMYVSDEHVISYAISPAGASQIVECATSDPSVATVDANGNIKAVGYGECEVRVSSVKKPSVRARIIVRVADDRVPDRIVAYPSPLVLEPTLTKKLEILTFPQHKPVSLLYESTDPSVAYVSADGVVTAKREGKCTIAVYTSYSRHKFALVPVTVKYRSTIRSVNVPKKEYSLVMGDVVPLEFTLSPENASRALSFTSENPNVAYVDENQNIVAARYGSTTIKIASYRNAGVSASVTVTVTDDRFPLTMTPESDNLKPVLRPSDEFRMSFDFSPETADKSFTWYTSDRNIVSVDDGYPVCVGQGVATVVARSDYNPDLYVAFSFTVEPDGYTLVMPERRTTVDGIDENMQKIENLRASVKHVLSLLCDSGEISVTERDRRAQIVDSAFDMYAFPWTVTKLQRYWKAENSEDGAKNFKPNTIYYGLPYTSGINSRRNYDVARALEAKRYVPVEGQKYYLLNQTDKEYKNVYVGNDCSSFVALALFGRTKYYGELDKTETLYYDPRLSAFDDISELRAGDILVRYREHVFMFLYWADKRHTQAVCIEQGGSEAGINTVSASVYTISDFTDDSYRPRRLRELEQP